MVNWDEIRATLSPIRDFEDLSRRWREAYAYGFVVRHYNLSMPEMAEYTDRLLNGDTRNRYADWARGLMRSFHQLAGYEIKNVLDLVESVDTQEIFEGFCLQTGIKPADLVNVLKYLVYWFIPSKKYLRELVKKEPRYFAAVESLRQAGLRYNLDIIAQGITPDARRSLAESTGVDEALITDLAHRADFSRMPWASAATISNIVGSGYGSVAKLAAADLEQVNEDFFRYGDSIHKNLKLGNEIENSHRIARIIPQVLVA